MRLLIHDLEAEEFERIFPQLPEDVQVVAQTGKTIKKCMGCFCCWTKTPGMCVIEDGYGNYGKVMGRCEELIIISRIVYGGFSPFVKNVLDRNIGYILPFFTFRNHEMHHAPRYSEPFSTSVWGYGEDVSDSEKKVFERLAKANALNYNAVQSRVRIFAHPEEIAGCGEVL